MNTGIFRCLQVGTGERVVTILTKVTQEDILPLSWPWTRGSWPFYLCSSQSRKLNAESLHQDSKKNNLSLLLFGSLKIKTKKEVLQFEQTSCTCLILQFIPIGVTKFMLGYQYE